jgi:hypothetical protein
MEDRIIAERLRHAIRYAHKSTCEIGVEMAQALLSRVTNNEAPEEEEEEDVPLRTQPCRMDWIEGRAESADLGIRQSLSRAVGVFASASSCSTSIFSRMPSPAPVFQHLPIAGRIPSASQGPGRVVNKQTRSDTRSQVSVVDPRTKIRHSLDLPHGAFPMAGDKPCQRATIAGPFLGSGPNFQRLARSQQTMSEFKPL